MSDPHADLARVAGIRWKLCLTLTSVMTVVYAVFILLVAYNKPLLATVLMPGLSLGILLGVLMIITTWVLIMIYVRWTNTHYDRAVAEFRRQGDR